jgi:hypothetical protein
VAPAAGPADLPDKHAGAHRADPHPLAERLGGDWPVMPDVVLPCPAARRMAGSEPAELIRAAIGVRSRRGILVAAPPRAAQKVGRTGPDPGQASRNSQPLPPVRGADIAGSYATPNRVIPRLGQVPQYTVQAAGTEGSHVLHNMRWIANRRMDASKPLDGRPR